MSFEYITLPDLGSLRIPVEKLLAQGAMSAFRSKREILRAGAPFLVG